MPTSFSQSVSDFRTMASGITTRLADLSGMGITAEDAAALNTYADELDALNSAQEELKAQMKAKTEELKVKMREAKARHSSLSKRVKIAIPQEEWTAFGITAKQ